jgi:hypothetical protein
MDMFMLNTGNIYQNPRINGIQHNCQRAMQRERESITGWCFGTFFHILGMSSSQLTNNIGVGQPPTRYGLVGIMG